MPRASAPVLDRDSTKGRRDSFTDEFEPIDRERDIEDWVVSNIDGFDLNVSLADVINQNIQVDLDSLTRRNAGRNGAGRDKAGKGGRGETWSRFRLERRRDVAIVSLLDSQLIKEETLFELSVDFGELIDMGYHRLLIDFGRVERMSSRIVAIISEARRRCAAAPGGELRISLPNRELAEIFLITGVLTEAELFPDVKAALEQPWPENSGPRPLPVSILSALLTRSPRDSSRTIDSADESDPLLTFDDQPPEELWRDDEIPFWLICEVGPRRGHFIPVRGSRFLIGRDATCHIRAESPTVSRVHAAIERLESIFLARDLGSMNGTIVNGSLIKDRDIPLHHGDRIQIGPLFFTVVIGYDLMNSQSLDQFISLWLDTGHDDGAIDDDDSLIESQSLADDDFETAGRRVHVTLSEGAVVVTPRFNRLDEQATIDSLRALLIELIERPVPRRVVLNLKHVSGVSSRAIGVLVAHHLRLDREGGALRLAEVPPRVQSTFERVRLPMLLECYAEVEEAVLAEWP